MNEVKELGKFLKKVYVWDETLNDWRQRFVAAPYPLYYKNLEMDLQRSRDKTLYDFYFSDKSLAFIKEIFQTLAEEPELPEHFRETIRNILIMDSL